MRIKNSINNIMSGVVINLSTNILTFLSRTIFIYILGKEYLGINGIITNILAMLSLAELGIGTAINFSLYKPLAEKNEKKIIALMQFYKKAYRWIGIIVFIVGLCIVPFLSKIISDVQIQENIYIIYLLFLIDVSYSYFMTYKLTLITADQSSYKLTRINLLCNSLKVVIQIGVLIITKSYYLYLISNIIVVFFQRLIINKKINELYPLLNKNEKINIEKSELKVIKKNVKAMIFHKIGDYCINGTDNIIISIFISTAVVGYYSNYLMIITMVNGIILLIFNSVTSSIGNLIASESDNKKKEEIFKILNFIGYILFSFCAIGMYFLFNIFIEMWVGKEYLLGESVVFLLMLNFYLTGMRVPVAVVKMAAGLYDEDKYTPIIQSIVNLVVSIVLVQKIGIVGVFLGTLASSLVLPCWQRPYLVYKYVLNMSSKQYFRDYLRYLLIIMLEITSLIYILKLITVESLILEFLLVGITSLIVLLLINYIAFKKTREFKYLYKLLKGVKK